MHIEAQNAIIDVLESDAPLTFPEMKDMTGLRGQDLRRGLKELIHEDARVYVHGVEEKEKQYGLKDD